MSALPEKRSRACGAGEAGGQRVKRGRVQQEFHRWRKEREQHRRESKSFYPVLPTAAWAERRHRLLHAPHSSPQPRGCRWVFRMFATQAAAFDFADSMNGDSSSPWSPGPLTAPHSDRSATKHETLESGDALLCSNEATHATDDSNGEQGTGRERAEVFAFEKASAGEAGGGRRAYAVCTYSSLWALYSRPYLCEEEPLPMQGTRAQGEAVPRNFYEVLREGVAAQLYFDLEYHYAHGENGDKEAGQMVYWLKRLVCHGVMAHYGIPCTEAQVLDLYSPSATKFSMHLLVRLGHLSSAALPGGCLELPVAFANNLQCGRFVQLLLAHLVESTAVPPHPRKAEFVAGFLDLVREAIAEADTNSPLLTLPSSVLMERLYHAEIGRDLFTFSVGTCVRGTVTATVAEAWERRHSTAPQSTSTVAGDDWDEETLALLLDVMEDYPESVPRAEQGAGSGEVTMDFSEMRELFTVSTEKGSGWFIDTGVYTRNRNFRLLGSHKQGRFYSPLLLSPTSTYHMPALPLSRVAVKTEPGVKAELDVAENKSLETEPPLSRVREVCHFEACCLASKESFSVEASKRRVEEHAGELHQEPFMHSLVCHELADCRQGSRMRLTCPFRTLPGGVTAWEEEEERPYAGGISSGYSASGMAESPHQEVDAFMAEVAAEEGGGIRSWIHYHDSNTLVYHVGGMRCFNIGRPHKSNANLLVANLELGTYFQGCLDPDCRAQGYRGPERRLPSHVLATIPGLERAEERELLPSTPSLLYRRPGRWEEDDRALAEALREHPSLCP